MNTARPARRAGSVRRPARVAGSLADQDSFLVARHLIDHAERVIDRADGKAGTLGAAAVAVLAFVPQTAVFPGALRSTAASALLLLAGLCWAAGIAALCLAIFPRIRPAEPGGPQLVSFTDFPRRFDAPVLQRLALAADQNLEQWLLAQAHALSQIAVAKYRFIRLGMVLLGLGVVCGVPAMAIG